MSCFQRRKQNPLSRYFFSLTKKNEVLLPKKLEVDSTLESDELVDILCKRPEGNLLCDCFPSTNRAMLQIASSNFMYFKYCAVHKDLRHSKQIYPNKVGPNRRVRENKSKNNNKLSLSHYAMYACRDTTIILGIKPPEAWDDSGDQDHRLS